MVRAEAALRHQKHLGIPFLSGEPKTRPNDQHTWSLSRSPKVVQQLSEPEVFGQHASLATCLLRRQRQNPGRGIGGEGIVEGACRLAATSRLSSRQSLYGAVY